MKTNTSFPKKRHRQRIRVLVITGTPGVGKTVTSKVLADRLGALYVSLTELVKNENLVLGIDEQRDTLIADIKKLSKRVRAIISSSPKDIIVDSHYAPDVISSMSASYIFVLRRDPSDLKTKLQERGYSEKKVLENVASEVLDVCLSSAIKKYGLEKVDEIDMTLITVEEAVEEILQVLDGRKPVLVGKVDWLGKLEEEGKLEDFIGKINFL